MERRYSLRRVVGRGVIRFLKLIVDPRQLSRFYALQDERAAKQGLWVAVIGLTLVQACFTPLGYTLICC